MKTTSSFFLVLGLAVAALPEVQAQSELTLEPLAPLGAVPVAERSLDQAQLSCLLEPSQVVDISSAVSGVVKTINTERGARVSKGQVLLQLHDGVERAQLETAKAKAEFARRKMKRNEELLKQKLLSDFEQDEIRTELHLARLEVREAAEHLKQRTIQSPIDGLVVSRQAAVGEYVGSDPLLRLVALSPLYAEVVVRASHYGEVAIGDTVEILVEGAVSGRYPGKVVIVDQVIDAASGTFGIRVELPNPDLALPAGLKCQVAFSEA